MSGTFNFESIKKPFAWFGMVVVGATLTLNYWRPTETPEVLNTVAPTIQVAPEATSSTATTSPPRSTTDASGQTTIPPEISTTEPSPEQSDVLVVTGPASSSRFGDFQVAVSLADGVIVDVVLVAEPGDRRSRAINGQAVPVYRERALDAQSADIDVISGATVTWRSYTNSLQGALDEIGFVS
jgi:uncharacterized protein with FMN-binding domain